MSIPVGTRVWVDFGDDPDYGRWLVKGPGVVTDMELFKDDVGLRVYQDNEPLGSDGLGWWIKSAMVSIIEESTEND